MKQDHDGLVDEQRRDLELGVALASLPRPELPDDMDARLRAAVEAERRRRRRHRSVATIALAAALAALVLGGAALAGAFDSGSHRPPSKTIFPSPLANSPTPYPTNAAGQTYGGAQEGAQADLQTVVAKCGENGYCWTSDLDGPTPMNPEEARWLQPARQRRAIPVYRADGVTQVGVFGDVSVPQPPEWLFDQMKSLASNAGDASAWAWWTLTTADKAAAATGNSSEGMTDPDRPVYVTFILGDFTNWLWSLPEGASAPEYSWIYEVIDADSHEVDGSGASAKPFEAAAGLDLNLVGLRDRVRM